MGVGVPGGVEIIVGVCAGHTNRGNLETCATQASADLSADVYSSLCIQLSQLSVVSCIGVYLAERHWDDSSE